MEITIEDLKKIQEEVLDCKECPKHCCIDEIYLGKDEISKVLNSVEAVEDKILQLDRDLKDIIKTIDKEGYIKLEKVTIDGKRDYVCSLYDPENRDCLIHSYYKPIICREYPFVLGENESVYLDIICPYNEELSNVLYEKYGVKPVFHLKI
jgi:Fe-S-cluster containining protein